MQVAELGHLSSAVWTLQLQLLNTASGQVKPATAELRSKTNASRNDQNWVPLWRVLAKRREGFSELLYLDNRYKLNLKLSSFISKLTEFWGQNGQAVPLNVELLKLSKLPDFLRQ